MGRKGWVLTLCVLAVWSVGARGADLVSLWNFNGDLTADVGTDLSPGTSPGPGPDDGSNYWNFENTSMYGSWAMINGQDANVVRVFHERMDTGFIAANDLSQNYEYTVVMDLMYLAPSGWTGNPWRSGGGVFDAQIDGPLHQVSQGAGWEDLNTVDSGVHRDRWTRFVYTIDVGNEVAVWANGQLIGSVPNSDARDNSSWWTAAFGFDICYNLYDVFLNSAAIFDGVMTPEEITALGGPHADGITTPGVLPSEPGTLTGLWNFVGGPDPNDGLRADIGYDMAYGGEERFGHTAEQAAQWLRANTGFITTDGVSVPHINAQPATVMHIPGRTGQYDSFYVVPHGVQTPNGEDAGGTPASVYTTEYTVGMDLLVVWSTWTGGIVGSGANYSWFEAKVDGDVAAQIMQGGGYVDMDGPGPGLRSNQWYRLFFTIDAGGTIKMYRNGKLVAWFDDSAYTPDTAWLATNDKLFLGRQISEAYISSLAVWNGVLSDAFIAYMGGPDAGGLAVPTGEFYLTFDLNKDHYVNLADFAIFANSWLNCSDPADSACDQYWK